MDASAAEKGETIREPGKLGSLKDWAEAKGLDPQDRETLDSYTEAMSGHSEQRASWLGITVDELHGLPSQEAAEELEESARIRDRQASAASMKGRLDTQLSA